MKIGAQFFTIRDYCKTISDLDESMKKVADIGYKHIQLSGVCAYEAGWMAEWLAAYGLQADITHFDYNRIVKDTDATIAFHDTMGCKYIGIGSNPKGATPEGLAAMAAEVRPAVDRIVASGHKFMYHNHHMEFARFGGKTFIDLLCETFTPAECGVTLDTYWVQHGGGDVRYWIEKLTGRIDILHLKDMQRLPVMNSLRGWQMFTEIGQGHLQWPLILEAAEKAGVKYYVVEQDTCPGDSLVSMQISADYLKTQL